MADSLRCTAETSTLESNYIPEKKKNKNLFPLSRGKKSLGFRWEIFSLGVLPLSPLPLPVKHSPGVWKLQTSLQGTGCRMSKFLNTIYLAQWRPGAMALLLRGLTIGAGDKSSGFGSHDRWWCEADSEEPHLEMKNHCLPGFLMPAHFLGHLWEKSSFPLWYHLFSLLYLVSSCFCCCCCLFPLKIHIKHENFN